MRRRRRHARKLQTNEIDPYIEELSFKVRLKSSFVLPIKFFLAKLSQHDLDISLYTSIPEQSSYIESLLLGPPVISISTTTSSNWLQYREIDGSVGITDGKQQLYSLVNFLFNNFSLMNLTTLDELNELRFSELPFLKQQRLSKTSVRLMEIVI